MEYRIKYAFYSPNNEYSGPAGRVIDEELYNKAIAWGYADRVEVVGMIPDTFLSDEELDNKLAELLAEREKRDAAKNSVTVGATAKEETKKEVAEDSSKNKSKK